MYYLNINGKNTTFRKYKNNFLYKAANSHITKKLYNMIKNYHHLLEAIKQTCSIFNNLKDFSND